MKLTRVPVQRGAPNGNTPMKLEVMASVPRAAPITHPPKHTIIDPVTNSHEH